MTWEQLTDLNNDGNEIGAHTVNHVSLKGLPVGPGHEPRPVGRQRT